MTADYAVGLKIGGRTEMVIVAAEDALIAALKAKCQNPAALITYVRRSNRRGDRRHPHQGLSEVTKA